MATITFDKVEMYGAKTVKCADGCGRRLTRRTTVFQTVNPFNKTADGKVKERHEIRAELAAELDKWKKQPEICIHCEAFREACK